MESHTNRISYPEYLNENLFNKILSIVLKHHQFHIKDLTFELGSAPGDNYCSEIYRSYITYKEHGREKKITLIVKSLPINENNQFLVKINAFSKEVTALTKVIPSIENLVENGKIGPKCYYTLNRPIETFFLEDLKGLGYESMKREDGLDEPQARLVFEKLGIFHAGSMILNKKDPECIKLYWHGLFREDVMDDAIYKSVFHTNLEYLISVVAKWEGYGKISKKLELFHKNFNDIMIKHVEPIIDEVKVLNHGDLWLNNMMFRLDPENPKRTLDVIFIDFQMGFFTSPGLDINYFLNTSLKLDVLRNKREELIAVYYNSLKSTLERANYPAIPSEKEIRHEVNRKELYGLMIASTMFPFMVMDREASQGNSIDAFVDDSLAQRKRDLMYSSKRVVETLKYSLKRSEDLGVLDAIL